MNTANFFYFILPNARWQTRGLADSFFAFRFHVYLTKEKVLNSGYWVIHEETKTFIKCSPIAL